jgi:ribosomal protein L40E
MDGRLKLATEQRVICDLCRSDENVSTMTVVWKYAQGRPWEIDLCERCYGNRMGDMADLGRRARINNVRPQARIKKTIIGPDNL